MAGGFGGGWTPGVRFGGFGGGPRLPPAAPPARLNTVSNGLTVPRGTRVVRPYAEPQASRAAPATAPPHAGGTPAPAGPTPFNLPTGSYNPQRDVETEEATRGLGQLTGELGTARSRDTADYFTNKSEIERRGGQQTADYQRAKDLLTQSFAKLGTRQQEGANQAGVLQGGAVLQAAAKRAANQQTQQTSADTAYSRQQEGNQLELAKLAREGAPPDATNALGGRNFQDLLTQLTNAQANNTFFGESQQRLAGQEAAERGYVPPSAPRAPVAKAAPARPAPRVIRPYAEKHTFGGRRH